MALRRFFDYSLSLALVFSDFVSIYSAYIFSFYVYVTWFGTSPQEFTQVLTLAVVPAALGVTCFFLTSVYRCQPGPMGLEQLRRMLFAYFWSGLLALSLTFFIKSQDFSRLMMTFSLGSGLLFVLIGRAIYVRITSMIQKNYNLSRRILILGGGKVGATLARNLINTPGQMKIIGFLDDKHPELKEVAVRVGDRDHLFPVLGPLTNLAQICRHQKPTEVIVAMTNASLALHQDLFDQVMDLNISFSIVPSALDLMLKGAESYSIGRIPLFRIGERPVFILSPALKRIFDIAGATLIGLLALPIWIVSAIAIKLDSQGPILFIHERVGLRGRKFNLYKFRSMAVDTDPYAIKTRTHNSAYVTKFGAFMRRTSIDEIPQLLNVLKGDMSLVGPRPEMPFIVKGYDELQKMRLSVKPGLTGVWQISADRANPIHENMDYDLYYLENQSFWLDLAILIKTFRSVLRGLGAY